ncbi:hypothetical protein [Bacillus sp. mrc49]|uniref:hypothetical protein n=1 Tax=Bacillus sp. mrc49 TaxID=2054913 RepID=UPI0012FE592E|nr:hypothetical protein [Bacillus sp. mrc49]
MKNRGPFLLLHMIEILMAIRRGQKGERSKISYTMSIMTIRTMTWEPHAQEMIKPERIYAQLHIVVAKKSDAG